MIKLLKNKEVRKALLWQLLLSAAACAVCFFFDIRAGLTAAGLSLLLMLVFCISTYKRYQRISSLADDINQVLHGDSSIDFDSYSEGELSILHSEIYKMTIRLREQQQTLTREKAYLADSIADISHQIRTPLTSINLLIGLLSEPKLTDARRQQLIHELYELLSRIDWLITTLLKISRWTPARCSSSRSRSVWRSCSKVLCDPAHSHGAARAGAAHPCGRRFPGRSLMDERSHRQYCEELHGTHPRGRQD
mgnify:CR=1 FL=1